MMETLLRIATWVAALLLVAGLGMTVANAAPAADVLRAGLLLLIATPVVRVLLALAGYIAERDWTFVAVTLVVLVSLIFPIVRFLVSLPG